MDDFAPQRSVSSTLPDSSAERNQVLLEFNLRKGDSEPYFENVGNFSSFESELNLDSALDNCDRAAGISLEKLNEKVNEILPIYLDVRKCVTSEASVYAAWNARYEVLDWLKLNNCRFHRHLCEVAYKKDDLQLFKWLEKNYAQNLIHTYKIMPQADSFNIPNYLYEMGEEPTYETYKAVKKARFQAYSAWLIKIRCPGTVVVNIAPPSRMIPHILKHTFNKCDFPWFSKLMVNQASLPLISHGIFGFCPLRLHKTFASFALYLVETLKGPALLSSLKHLYEYLVRTSGILNAFMQYNKLRTKLFTRGVGSYSLYIIILLDVIDQYNKERSAYNYHVAINYHKLKRYLSPPISDLLTEDVKVQDSLILDYLKRKAKWNYVFITDLERWEKDNLERTPVDTIKQIEFLWAKYKHKIKCLKKREVRDEWRGLVRTNPDLDRIYTFIHKNMGTPVRHI